MTVVLDTNALIWLLEDKVELGERATQEIDDAFRSTGVLISAASFWEVAMLSARKRIVLHRPVAHWRLDALRLGIEEVPLDGALAIDAVALPDLHADPADRFVVATALKFRANLVTSDERLLTWKGPLTRINARI
jgi:PIN domain nuclease of toxin-antitoxin system